MKAPRETVRSRYRIDEQRGGGPRGNGRVLPVGTLSRPGPHLCVLLVFMVLLGIIGGTSKPESLTLLVVRPGSILALALLLLVPAPRDWALVRPWLLLLGILAAWISIQAVPLPPGLWMNLPGHAFAAGAASLTGQPQPWRPLSLTPDLTVNSLLDLLPPLVVLAGYASLDHRERGWLAPTVIGIALASVLVALAQLAGGSGSGAYLYGDGDENLPVGLLSNRNHQALLLAIGIIAIGHVLRTMLRRTEQPLLPTVVAAATALLFLAMVVASGSRTGLLFGGAAMIVAIGLNLAMLGKAGAAGIVSRKHAPGARRGLWPMLMIVAGVSGAVLVLMAILLSSGRGIALVRFGALTDTGAEMRWRGTPVVLEQVWAFLPFGSGFGSFDAVFRMNEPDALLKPTFFNHAHNDVLEMALCGGVPALAIVAGFVAICVRCLRSARGGDRLPPLLVPGAGVITLTTVSSLFDYPLRTPLMAAVFTLACCWLRDRGRRKTADPE